METKQSKSEQKHHTEQPEQMLILKYLSEWRSQRKIWSLITNGLFPIILMLGMFVLICISATSMVLIDYLIKIAWLKNLINIGIISICSIICITTLFFTAIFNAFDEKYFLKFLRSKGTTINEIFTNDEKNLDYNRNKITNDKKALTDVKFALLADYHRNVKSSQPLKAIAGIILPIIYYIAAAFASITTIITKLLLLPILETTSTFQDIFSKISNITVILEIDTLQIVLIYFIILLISMLIGNLIFKIIAKPLNKKCIGWCKATYPTYMEKLSIADQRGIGGWL